MSTQFTPLAASNMTPAVVHWTRLHPYLVYGPRGFDSRFADLRCAVKTALYRGEDYWVMDQRSGAEWRGEELRREVEG